MDLTLKECFFFFFAPEEPIPTFQGRLDFKRSSTKERRGIFFFFNTVSSPLKTWDIKVVSVLEQIGYVS